MADTMAELGEDAEAYRRLVTPFVEHGHELLADSLGPLGVPRHPLLMLQFGVKAIRSAESLAKRFRGDRARALLAGCAGHSILPLDRSFTAAIGLMFLVTAHVENWPVAAGGSHSITKALASLLESLGGHIETNVDVQSAADLPPAKIWMFDTSPDQMATIARPAFLRGLSAV